MKTKDKEFIREIVSSDFKQISNPNFLNETLEKIAALEENKLSCSNSVDITFLIPQVIYVSLFILFSLVTAIISWTQWGQINNVSNSIEMISGFLLNPLAISILLSFSLLYFIDLYIKKVSA
jgi:hypothetical protein